MIHLNHFMMQFLQQNRTLFLGDYTETTNCSVFPCPTWGDWQSPTECTVSCGLGVALEFRDCLFALSNDQCGNEDYVRKVPCNSQPCPHWSPWSR